MSMTPDTFLELELLCLTSIWGNPIVTILTCMLSNEQAATKHEELGQHSTVQTCLLISNTSSRGEFAM